MKLKKLINLYMALQVFGILIIGMALTLYDAPFWLWIPVFASAIASLIVAVSMGNVEWHQTREEMIADQKESVRVTRNASKLIDQLKKETFKKNIMTKEQVSKIMGRTYEETLND